MSGPRDERYYQPVQSATQQGAEIGGRGPVREVPEGQVRSYYGKGVVKQPVWTWEVPWYLFFGGLAGASSGLCLAARIAGNHSLARRALLVALGGAAVSPVLLISDLGRPERFYMMLRVFKPTSPMSIGTWILSAFGTTTGAAVAADLLGIPPKLGRTAEVASALLGPPLTTYTAVLLSDTSVPTWHEARKELPFVFAASSTASAGAAAVILTSTEQAGAARRLAIGGAIAEIATSEYMKRRLGKLLSEPYKNDKAGRYEKLSIALTCAGATAIGVLGRRSRIAAAVGGAGILAGAIFKRWSVFEAGVESARDPKYVVLSQRERLRDRNGSSGG
ncbi:polysulfide reductase NrfD [soil metagenome]